MVSTYIATSTLPQHFLILPHVFWYSIVVLPFLILNGQMFAHCLCATDQSIPFLAVVHSPLVPYLIGLLTLLVTESTQTHIQHCKCGYALVSYVHVFMLVCK